MNDEIKKLKKEAKNGNTKALIELGNIYKEGKNVEKNLNKALRLYKKAALECDPEALEIIKKIYEQKEGIFKNQKLGKKLIEQLEKKIGKALNEKSYAYLYDSKTEEALEYALRAAKLGFLDSYILKNIAEKSIEEKNLKNALECYITILKNEPNEIMIAYIVEETIREYKNKSEITKNKDLIIECYELAAKAGNVNLYDVLGEIFFEGTLAKKDFKKALEYYEKYLELDQITDNETIRNIIYSDVFYKIGKIYENGWGVEKDIDKAEEYYNKCHKNGIENEFESFLDDEFIVKFLKKLVLSNPADKHLLKVLETIEKNANIVKIQSIKELTDEKIESLDDNTVIFLENKDSRLCYYTLDDMKKILAVCKEIIHDIDKQAKEEDKLMQVYIKLGLLISYDYKALDEEKEEKNTSSRNLMVLTSKKGVCLGFAESLSVILDFLGIESKSIDSLIDNKLTLHEFNQVKINGKWYYCDLTWDEKNIPSGKIEFFLLCKKDFETNIYHKTTERLEAEQAEESYKDVKKLFVNNFIELARKSESKVLIEKALIAIAKNYLDDTKEDDHNPKIIEFLSELPQQFKPTGKNQEIKPQHKKETIRNIISPYLLQLMEQGNEEAAILIGDSYIKQKKYQEAGKIFRKLAEQGSSEAQYRLGYMYKNGIGMKKNRTEAKKLYTSAAKQGDASLQYLLGIMHNEDGEYEEALKWIKLSAQQDYHYALQALGTIYIEGIGVEKNYELAFKYYTKAVEQGNIGSLYYLGLMYENGMYVQQNKEKALEYYQKAFDEGMEEAQKKLEELTEQKERKNNK